MPFALLILTALGCLDVLGLVAATAGLVWLVTHGVLGLAGTLLLAPLVLWATAAVMVRLTVPVLAWLLAEEAEETAAADEAPRALLPSTVKLQFPS